MRPVPLAALALAIAAGAALSADALGLRPADLAARAARAADYMERVQRPDGLFRYEYDFLAGGFSPDDNIVRQTGSTAALAEYLQREPESGLTSTVARALAALRDASLPRNGRLILSATRSDADARAGAIALALLAEHFYAGATGAETFAEARKGWLAALLALQLPGGGFPASAVNPEESSFYNGEAWLALAHHVNGFPQDAPAAAALARTEARVMARYAEKLDGGFAHWGMMASAVRHAATGERRYLDFGKAMATAFLDTLRPRVNPASNSCSAVEGLASVGARLAAAGEAGTPLYQRIRRRVLAEMPKSFGMQIAEGQDRLALGADGIFEDPRIAEFAGAFLNGRDVLRARIDTTQHCLSAILKTEAFLHPPR